MGVDARHVERSSISCLTNVVNLAISFESFAIVSDWSAVEIEVNCVGGGVGCGAAGGVLVLFTLLTILGKPTVA